MHNNLQLHEDYESPMSKRYAKNVEIDVRKNNTNLEKLALKLNNHGLKGCYLKNIKQYIIIGDKLFGSNFISFLNTTHLSLW